MRTLLNLLSRSASGSPVIQAAVFAALHGAAVVVAAQLGFIAINVCTGTPLTDLVPAFRFERRLSAMVREIHGPPIHPYWLLFIPGIAASARLCFSASDSVYGFRMRSAFVACLTLGWLLPVAALAMVFASQFGSVTSMAHDGGASQRAADMPSGFVTSQSFILFVTIGLFGVAYAVITFPIALWKLARHPG